MVAPEATPSVTRKTRPVSILPRLRGRYHQLAPEKIEMVAGRLFWSDEDRRAMLALLLENLGADAALRYFGPC